LIILFVGAGFGSDAGIAGTENVLEGVGVPSELGLGNALAPVPGTFAFVIGAAA